MTTINIPNNAEVINYRSSDRMSHRQEQTYFITDGTTSLVIFAQYLEDALHIAANAGRFDNNSLTIDKAAEYEEASRPVHYLGDYSMSFDLSAFTCDTSLLHWEYSRGLTYPNLKELCEMQRNARWA